MTDKPRSIIMPNEDAPTAIVSPDKAIISPEEAKRRITGKGVRDGGKSGGHAISRAEAVSIAVQIGQEVYDQLRGEHALSMGELQQDLANHFGEIRRITAMNILDLQRRSFSYRIRRDFGVDLQRMAAKLAELWGRIRLDFAVDVESIAAWLELHGLRAAPPPSTPVVPITTNMPFDEEADPEHVGAPTELPEPPEVARAFTLSSSADEAAGT